MMLPHIKIPIVESKIALFGAVNVTLFTMVNFDVIL